MNPFSKDNPYAFLWSKTKLALRQEETRFKRELKQLAKKEPSDVKAFNRLAQTIEEHVQAAQMRWKGRPLMQYPTGLPILQQKETIIGALQQNRTLVVAAETGSGKSTQLPKFCLEAGLGRRGKIGCVQPRRLGAVGVAERIAEELGEPVGQTIGYRIRFEERGSPHSFIRIMTDGVLLAELQRDPLLLEYDALIVDEAHERTLNIDLILGLLQDLRHKRRDLKIIIASATIDTEKFSQAFEASVFEAQGRVYPVSVIYRPLEKGEESDLAARVLAVCQEILNESRFGDILIFLPTEEEIKNSLNALNKLATKEHIVKLPLFARLTAKEQRRIFESYSGRKIIASTNIAETTLTIPGIKYVIDAGLARISRYSSAARIQSLPVLPVSQASANQRMGRAGRTQEGVCYRLYSEEDFKARALFTEPEIKRANLAEAVLRMLALRIGDIENFPFLDRPDGRLFNEAFKTLFELGAIDGTAKNARRLTSSGRMMARLPIDPRLSRILIESQKEGCLSEAVTTVSALAGQDLRERPQEKRGQADQRHALFNGVGSDFLFYLNLYAAAAKEKDISNAAFKRFCQENFLNAARMREWFSLRAQIMGLLADKGYKESSLGNKSLAANKKQEFGSGYEALHRSLLSGYLSQIALLKEEPEPRSASRGTAKRKSNRYELAGKKEAFIFPASQLFNQENQQIFSAVIVKTGKLYLRASAAINFQWLATLAGHLVQYRPQTPYWSQRKGETLCMERGWLFGFLIDEGKETGYLKYDAAAARDIFIKEALLQENFAPELEQRFPFLKSNLRVKEAAQKKRDKLRNNGFYAGDDAMMAFYQERLAGIAGWTALALRIKEAGDTGFYLKEEDLLTGDVRGKLEGFPDTLKLNGFQLPLIYNFNPAGEEDGFSVLLSPDQVAFLPSNGGGAWVPPGMLLEKLQAMAKALPKSERTKLQPTQTTLQSAAACLDLSKELSEELSSCLKRTSGIWIDPSLWLEAERQIEPRLRLRYDVRNSQGQTLIATRNFAELKAAKLKTAEEKDLKLLAAVWEEKELKGWPSQDLLPESVSITGKNGIKLGLAYPALTVRRDKSIDLRLYVEAQEALAAHLDGVAALLEIKLKKELAQMRRSYETPLSAPGAAYFGGSRAFDQTLFWPYFIRCHLRLNLRGRQEFSAIEGKFTQDLFQKAQEEKKSAWLALEAYAVLRRQLAALMTKNAHLKNFLRERGEDLENLMGSHAWDFITPRFLHALPRFIKALSLRTERGIAFPAKDKEKALPLQGWSRRIAACSAKPLDETQKGLLKEARYFLAELVCKTFAAELKGPKIAAADLEAVLQNLP